MRVSVSRSLTPVTSSGSTWTWLRTRSAPWCPNSSWDTQEPPPPPLCLLLDPRLPVLRPTEPGRAWASRGPHTLHWPPPCPEALPASPGRVMTAECPRLGLMKKELNSVPSKEAAGPASDGHPRPGCSGIHDQAHSLRLGADSSLTAGRPLGEASRTPFLSSESGEQSSRSRGCCTGRAHRPGTRGRGGDHALGNPHAAGGRGLTSPPHVNSSAVEFTRHVSHGYQQFSFRQPHRGLGGILILISQGTKQRSQRG